MNKSLVLLALALVASGCGEDQLAPSEPSESQVLAQVAGGEKTTNVGAACSSDDQCTGSAASCLTVVPLDLTPNARLTVTYPGGFCSAQCKADADCGSAGGCPVAEYLSLINAVVPGQQDLVAKLSICVPKCNAQSDCRDGYVCQAPPANPFAVAPRNPQKFCTLPGADAGTPAN